MSSPSVPQNGVYRESPIPRKALRAQARASRAVAIIDSFPVGDGQVKSEPPSTLIFAPVMYSCDATPKTLQLNPFRLAARLVAGGPDARSAWRWRPSAGRGHHRRPRPT